MLITDYWKIVYIMYSSRVVEVKRLILQLSFMCKLQEFDLYFHPALGGWSFTTSPTFLREHWGSPVGLDAPETHSECDSLGFCSALPLSRSCHFKEPHRSSRPAVFFRV